MKRRWLILFSIYLIILGGGWAAGHVLSQWAAIDVRPSNEPEIHAMVMIIAVVYIIASCVPFIPGAEIGFGLIAIFGSRIIPLVYLCMVAALVLSYCVGRFVPASFLVAFFGWLGLTKSQKLVTEMAGHRPEQRASMLTAISSNRLLPFLVRHRFLALAAAFNLPGNSLVGGGGGLALAAGMSGLFPIAPFIVITALAVSPLPLLILLTGYQP